MNIVGKIQVPASISAVFEKLSNPIFFASCIDGVSNLTEIGQNKYSAVLETKIAYIKMKFAITVEITELDSPHKITAKTEGNPIGLVGRLTTVSTANLSELDDETVIDYAIDIVLTGKLGSLGQPVLRSKAKELENQFANNLKNAFLS
jgi:carbon monoxide dehydrogenase subunit G